MEKRKGNRMNKILLYAIVCLALFSLPVLAWDSGSSSWNYCRVVTITNPVAENLSNYTALLSINGTLFNKSSFSNGTDIKIVDASDCIASGNPIYYEILYFNTSDSSKNSTLLIPINITASATNTISVYYGNSGSGTFQSKGIWDINTVMVQPFCNLSDYTNNNITGILGGSPIANTSSGSPFVCSYQFTQASKHSVNFSDTKLNFNNTMTIEVWIKPKTSGIQSVISKNAQVVYADYTFILNTGTNGADVYASRDGASWTTLATTTSKDLDDGNWHYWVYRQNGASFGNDLIDGNLYANDTSSGSGAFGNNITISGSTAGGWYDGYVSMVKISNVTRSLLWLNATFLNWSVTAGTEMTPSGTILTYTSPNASITYHNASINLSYLATGTNATYLCFHIVNNDTSSNYSVNNNTEYHATITAVNGTNNISVNCSFGISGNSTVSNMSFTNVIGYVILNTMDEATNNYTQANITSILIYNSSSSVNFTGNNFTWAYTQLPGGSINIIAFYSNITRSTAIINNATNYQNITLSFPAFTGNYYFLIHNSYNQPLNNTLVSFYTQAGVLITQLYSQDDGYVYDIFLTRNIPIFINMSRPEYIAKSITFIPYFDTLLPVRIRMDQFFGNGTQLIPFQNITFDCNPKNSIQSNGTAITCLLQESNSQLLGGSMNVYYINYSGSYLSKTTNCVNPGTCTYTFTLNKTGAKFTMNFIINATYGNYTFSRDYYTNSSSYTNLPKDSGMGVSVWQFIFLVIMICVLALSWGFMGPVSLVTIIIIMGVGVLYGVFGVGEFLLVFIVSLIIFMKMV